MKKVKYTSVNGIAISLNITSTKVMILYTVRTPIVDPFPIEDPSLKIQIEDLFLFSKKWVLGVLY